MFSLSRSTSQFIMLGRVNYHNYLRRSVMLYSNLKKRHHISNSTVASSIPTTLSISEATKAAHMLNSGESPLLEKTIGQLLSEASANWPEHVAIVSLHQNTRITFSDLLRRVDAFAAGLKKLGLKKGDRIGIWGPNDLEWIIAYLSSARIGLINVGINPAYQQSELMYSLQKVGIKAVVSPAMFKSQNYPQMLLTAKETCPALQHIIIHSSDYVTGTHRFVDVEASATKTEVQAIDAEQSDISCYDGCNIQFTSGSTGKPKATLLSHKSIANNSKAASRRAKLDAENKICVNVPFFHAFAMSMAQTLFLHTGSTLVLEERSFTPAKSLEAITKEKCTITYGTPTMWIALINEQKRLQLPMEYLRMGFIGGSPAVPELFKRIDESFHIDNMMTIYGLTETTSLIFQSLYEQDAYLTANTIGYVSEYVEAMVVDKTGIPVPYGVPGELWVRGYCTMMRYWDDEERTREILTEDGWLKTGDQFILHENGYGSVVGRFKEIIIRGGENIIPKEIEDLLMSHPAVMESQVIGVHDDYYGEDICACVKLYDNIKITTNELREYCKGKISHFKIPRYIVFVDEYPKTTSGKIQKFRLREDMESKGVIPTKPK